MPAAVENFNARHRCIRPNPRPGVRKTCVCPAFLPSRKNVELTSSSGQSLPSARYWKAVFETSCLPIEAMSPVGKLPPSVVCTSKFLHPLPSAIPGEMTASRIDLEPPGTVQLKSSGIREPPSLRLAERH